MTELLYMDDSYLKEWDAVVERADGPEVVLDRTAFYPVGGGQPSDAGIITSDGRGFEVLEVRKKEGVVWHKLDKPGLEPGDKVHCQLDWNRRYQLMRMHTAAHLLAALMNSEAGALITGNQLGVEKSRIDFNLEDYSPEKVARVVETANQKISEGAEVKWYTLPREAAMQIPGIVKLAARLPPSIKELRIVEIKGIDKQADGGTHVHNIREIGRIKLIKTENKGKNNRRMYYTLE